MVNERRRVMSEDGQFPGFCLPIHQRGQTLYDSKNLSSFSYPDGILVQFKLSLSVYFYYTISSLDSISNLFQQNMTGFSRPRLPRTTAVWRINHRRSMSPGGWKVPKASAGDECARHLSQHEQLCWRVRQRGQGRVKLGPNQT